MSGTLGGGALGVRRRPVGGLLHRAADLHAERLDLGLGRKEALASKRLPQNDTRGVHVRLPRDVPLQLLGGHVGHLALVLAFPRSLKPRACLRHTEVEHARNAVRAHDQVLRRHVSVHDVEGLPLFVAEVVPILQDRGLFRLAYEGTTLREHLALPIPRW